MRGVRMKVLIDIPKELAEKGHWYTDEEMWIVIKAAQNGTPIPDNATNGDVIKAMFPNVKTELGVDKVIFARGLNNVTPFSEEWWYAKYQKGDKE